MKKILVDRDSAIVRALKCIKDDSIAYDVAKAIKCLPTYELSDKETEEIEVKKALKELTIYSGYGMGCKVIFIKYLADVEKIERIKIGNWIDLRAAETVGMFAGESRLIPLGIAMELPEGYEAIIAPRSSTYGNYGIIQTNSIGIIDSSYCGDGDQWYFPALAMRNTTIHKGDRICQFRIIKRQPNIEFMEVESLNNNDRGGFGSTGKR